MKKIGIITVLLLGFVVLQAQAQQAKHQFLLFWRSDCGNCEVAIRQLVAKCATLNRDSFTLTTISFDTDSVSYFNAIKNNKMEIFNNKYDFNAGFINNSMAKKYGVTKTPTLLYIDAEGKVLATMQEAFTKLSSLK